MPNNTVRLTYTIDVEIGRGDDGSVPSALTERDFQAVILAYLMDLEKGINEHWVDTEEFEHWAIGDWKVASK